MTIQDKNIYDKHICITKKDAICSVKSGIGQKQAHMDVEGTMWHLGRR